MARFCEQPDANVLHRRLWEHALGWLVEKRARQPLNGLILTLDLPDLLTADKRRREYLQTTLRSRLRDVRQQLHCQLPVYVVLTRLDLLHGFATLFQSLDKKIVTPFWASRSPVVPMKTRTGEANLMPSGSRGVTE